jgi:hypothetical protein
MIVCCERREEQEQGWGWDVEREWGGTLGKLTGEMGGYGETGRKVDTWVRARMFPGKASTRKERQRLPKKPLAYFETPCGQFSLTMVDTRFSEKHYNYREDPRALARPYLIEIRISRIF